MGNVLETFRNPLMDLDIEEQTVLVPSGIPTPPGSRITGGSNYCANSPDVYGNNAYFNCLDVINLHVWNPPTSATFWGSMIQNTPLVTNGGTNVQSISGWTIPSQGFPNFFASQSMPLSAAASGLTVPVPTHGIFILGLQLSIDLASVTTPPAIGSTIVLVADFLNITGLRSGNVGTQIYIPYYANTGFVQPEITIVRGFDSGTFGTVSNLGNPRYAITGPAGVNLTIATQIVWYAFMTTF